MIVEEQIDQLLADSQIRVQITIRPGGYSTRRQFGLNLLALDRHGLLVDLSRQNTGLAVGLRCKLDFRVTVVLVGMRRVVVVVVVGATMVEGGCCVTAVLVIRCSVPLFTDKRGDDVTELSSLCISVCNNDRGVMTVARSDRRNDGVVAFSVAVESPKNKGYFVVRGSTNDLK